MKLCIFWGVSVLISIPTLPGVKFDEFAKFLKKMHLLLGLDSEQ